jgi:hypothetical protein
MNLKDISISWLGAILGTVVGGIILAWILATPRSNIHIDLDWIEVDHHQIISHSDLQRFLDFAGIARDQTAVSPSTIGRFVFAEIRLENTSQMTANKVDLHVPRAIFIQDSRRVGKPYLANADGLVSIGEMRPGDSCKIYIVIEDYYFQGDSSNVRATADGIAVPIYKTKISSPSYPFVFTIVRLLSNSVWAQAILVNILFLVPFILVMFALAIYAHYNQKFRIKHMKPSQRRQLLGDADYIRQHHPLDDLAYQQSKENAAVRPAPSTADPQKPE